MWLAVYFPNESDSLNKRIINNDRKSRRFGQYIRTKRTTLKRITINKVSMQVPSIIDIEASGFGAHSYPIEIGVVREDGGKFCQLVKPYESWTHWEPEAQALHGLSREHLLKHGHEGREVCVALNEFLQGRTVYSDGWVVDHPWLIKLFSAAGVPMRFEIRALEYVLSEYQMDHWQSVKNHVTATYKKARHRASVDAHIIQQTYYQTRQVALNRNSSAVYHGK